MVPRVSMMPMVPRVSVISEGMPDGMVGLDQREKSKCASRISTMPKRRGVEDIDGVAGADDLDVSAGVKDVGRVHGGGCGALRRWRPWSKIAVLVFDRREINTVPRWGMVAQKP